MTLTNSPEREGLPTGLDHRRPAPGRPLPPGDPAVENRPAKEPGSGRRWLRTLLILLVAVAVCVALVGWRITSAREAAARIELAEVTLVARQTPLGTAGRPGTVTDLRVGPGTRVTADDVIAVVTEDILEFGIASSREHEILAPIDGVIASVEAPVGSSIASGASVVIMYNPQSLELVAPVEFGLLSQVRLGAVVHLSFPEVGDLEATVVRVDPRLDDPVGSDDPVRADLVMMVEDPTLLEDLVPGLTMSGWIERDSGDDGAPVGLRLDDGE